MKAIIRAPLLSLSGYGIHSRQVYKWAQANPLIKKIDVQILPWGITPWIINPEFENGLIGHIMAASGCDLKNADISFQVRHYAVVWENVGESECNIAVRI